MARKNTRSRKATADTDDGAATTTTADAARTEARHADDALAPVTGEVCPLSGATDVYSVKDSGHFYCRSSGVEWRRPGGRKVVAETADAYRRRVGAMPPEDTEA